MKSDWLLALGMLKRGQLEVHVGIIHLRYYVVLRICGPSQSDVFYLTHCELVIRKICIAISSMPMTY